MAKEQFSKIGYVLAVAGSAVGLGNAWKFPYMVGETAVTAFDYPISFDNFSSWCAYLYGRA